MKKKVLLIGLASTLAVGTCVAAVLFTRGQNVAELKGTEDLTLTINAGEITTSPTFTETPATFEHATDATKSSATKNMVEFEYYAVSYGTQSETNYNYFQVGIGYIMNTKGHELKSLSSVVFHGSGNMDIQWGWLVGDAIKYENSKVVSAETVFDFYGDKPNYIKMTSTSYGGNEWVSQIVFSYDSQCKSSKDPYSDGLHYRLYDDHAEVLGFSGSPVADLVIPDTVNGLPITDVADDAFRNKNAIETVTLGANVVNIGEYAFCSPNIETVTGFDQLKRIEYCAFNNTKISGTITFGPDLEWIAGSAFYSCNSLTAVVFDDDCTASVNNGAFNWCSEIISCHIGSKMTSTVPTFYGAFKMTTFTVGAGNTGFAAFDGVLYIFSGSDLQGMVCPLGKTSYVAPNDSRVYRLNYEFAEDALIETADLGDYIRVLDGSAFINCTHLKTVTGNGITNVGYQTFKGCTALTSVTLPVTMNYIDSYAFQDCTSLTSINFAGTVEEWEKFNRSSYWNDGSSLTQIVCSDDTIIL